MRSALKSRAERASATAEDVMKYDEYRALQTQDSKRAFYYNSWIVDNPKSDAVAYRVRSSQRKDEKIATGYGWVDREFIADRLGYKDWRNNAEQRIKLEHKLSQLTSRPHEAAAVLTDGMDKLQYQWQEKVDRTNESNLKRMEIQQGAQMDENQLDQALEAIDGLGANSETLAGRNKGTKKRTPSRSPTGDAGKGSRDPEWLLKFKKEGPSFFRAQKRASELALSQADEILNMSVTHHAAIKDDALAVAYVQSIRQQSEVLRTADREAANFELPRQSQKPTENSAEELCSEWKAAGLTLKAARQTFLNACLKMQTDLRSKFAVAVAS